MSNTLDNPAEMPGPGPADHEPGALPQRTRGYQSPHLDSTMWDDLVPRDDDIVIATPYKSGTTWMQQIVAMLVFQGAELPENLHTYSPWVDMRMPPREEKMPFIEGMRHRRFLKSHLPLDGLRFFPRCKYIYVGRDGRDVFMSLFNHFRNQIPERIAVLNRAAAATGIQIPPCPEDPRELWDAWISRGVFPWEKDGYPWWSFLHHVRTWWDYRHLPNILFVHFANLKQDLAGEMRRISAFLNIPVDEARFPAIVDKCTFAYMKRNAARMTRDEGNIFRGGAGSFIYKGTNGRWREVLTAEDLARYDAVVADRLEPACARWLETGALPGEA